MNKQVVVKREPHALDPIRIPDPLRWRERKKMWFHPPCKRLGDLEHRLSSLRSGFKSHEEREMEIDRIQFYLQVADRYDRWETFLPNWNEGQMLPTRTHEPEHEKAMEHAKLARQAVKALCEGFFKPDKGCGCRHSVNLALTPEVFPMMLWFFRRRRSGGLNDNNLDPMGREGFSSEVPQHYLDTIKKFAKEFCLAAWDYREYARYRGDGETEQERQAVHDRLRKDLISLVDLMERLRMLKIIADNQRLCDSETYGILKIHVLSQVHSFPSPRANELPGDQYVERTPRDLKEACSIGSSLAKTLLTVESRLEYPPKPLSV